ncbi:MAG: hypothetical protein WAT91_15365 [Saprospiraceae bacterium]
MTKKKPLKKRTEIPFEHIGKPLLDQRSFNQRQFKYVLYAFCFLIICLGTGMLGYHFIGGLGWVSAYHNATMILSGMGEIDKMPTDAAKLFSGTYALVSGVVFLVTIAVMLSPILHRFLHKMHIEEPDDKE